MEREQYNKIYDNGRVHFDAAEILAGNKHYGLAISHLILGIEELIKFQVVMNYSSADDHFDEKEVEPKHRNSVFRDHLKKHDLIKEFQKAISPEFSEKFQDYIFHVMTHQELTPEHLETKANRFKEIGSFLASSYKDINIPEAEKETFFEWLNKANDLKNKGFYVNWKEDGCESPAEIPREDYIVALKYSNAILKQTEVIKSMNITDDEFIEMMNSPASPDLIEFAKEQAKKLGINPDDIF